MGLLGGGRSNIPEEKRASLEDTVSDTPEQARNTAIRDAETRGRRLGRLLGRKPEKGRFPHNAGQEIGSRSRHENGEVVLREDTEYDKNGNPITVYDVTSYDKNGKRNAPTTHHRSSLWRRRRK